MFTAVTRTIAVLLLASLPVAASAGEVQHRMHNERARIHHAERTGAITPGQAHHLEHRVNRIERQRDRDLARHGGRLTSREYHHLNRDERHLSNRIHHDSTR